MTEDPEHAKRTEDTESAGEAGAAVGAGWHRLHPLSPLIRAGGLVSGLLGLLVLSLVTADSYKDYLYQVVVAAGLLVTGFIRWLVTRWKLDGTTLRIETGLLRRDSRQLPMTRIQAVDVVRPLLARMLGLAALRIRLAGAGHGGERLAYLTVGEAARLRATLLAGQHGLDPATPEAAELPVISRGRSDPPGWSVPTRNSRAGAAQRRRCHNDAHQTTWLSQRRRCRRTQATLQHHPPHRRRDRLATRRPGGPRARVL